MKKSKIVLLILLALFLCAELKFCTVLEKTKTQEEEKTVPMATEATDAGTEELPTEACIATVAPEEDATEATATEQPAEVPTETESATEAVPETTAPTQTNPATNPTTKPAGQPSTKPTTNPTTEPATEPATEPPTQPVTEPQMPETEIPSDESTEPTLNNENLGEWT